MSGSYPAIQVPDFGQTLFRAQAAQLAQEAAAQRRQEIERQNALTEAFRQYAPGITSDNAAERLAAYRGVGSAAPNALMQLLPLIQQERQGQELAAALGGGGAPQMPVAPQASAGGLFDRLAADESGGNPTARNPRSSATGAFQFIDGTWRQFAQANPDLFAGMSEQQIMAARNDPQMSRRAAEWYARENGRQLSARGLPVNDGTLALSHRFGPEGATALLQAPAATPVAQVVGAQVMAANPDLAGRTVGDVVGRYQQRFGGDATPASAGSDNPRLAQIDAQIERLTPLAATNPRAAQILQLLMAQRQQYARGETAPLESVEGPDGKPVLVPRSQAVGRTPVRAPQVQVNMGGDNAFSREYEQAQGKAAAEILPAAGRARSTLSRLNNVEQLLERVQTGPGAQARVTVGGLAQQLGIPGDVLRGLGLDPEMVASGEGIRSITSQLLVGLIGSGGFPAQNFSNADRDMLERSLPALQNTPGGNRVIIQVLREAARRDIAIGDAWGRYVRENGGRASAELYQRFQLEELPKITEQDAFGDLLRPFTSDVSPTANGVQAAPPPQPAQQPVRVRTPEEARRLPSGTPILLPDGTVGRVP